jgi:hypothetical protein
VLDPEGSRLVDAVIEAVNAGNAADIRLLLHPYLHFRDGDRELRGRSQLLVHFEGLDDPLLPATSVELRDGQIYRWDADHFPNSGGART